MATKKKTHKIKKEKKEVPKKLTSVSFLQGPLRKTKIRIVGIGGGGGSIVSELAVRLKKASFVIANTDLRALKKSTKKAVHFSFGQDLTHGLGTGMNPELGRVAAENETERIKKLLEGQDLCILVVSLGGGTGSGAAPVFAKTSKKLGNLTYGIFTLPFKFEGEKKMEIAKNSLEKLKLNLDALTVIPNERIFQIIDKNTPLKEALSEINKTLSQSLEGLIETIYLPGLINIDFADFRTILAGQGKLTSLSTVEIEGPNRIDEAIKKIISNPLYPYTIRGARGVLFNIAGEENVSLEEISRISKSILESVNKGAKIIFGLSQKKTDKEKIKITLLATGCKTKIPFSDSPKTNLDLGKRLRENLVQKKRAQKTKRKKEKRQLPPAKKSSKTELQQKKKSQKNTPSRPKSKKGKGKEKPEKMENSEVKKEEPQTSATLKDVKQPPDFFEEIEKFKTERVRKNAVQIQKEIETQEEEMIRREKEWETPALFRRRGQKWEKSF